MDQLLSSVLVAKLDPARQRPRTEDIKGKSYDQMDRTFGALQILTVTWWPRGLQVSRQEAGPWLKPRNPE